MSTVYDNKKNVKFLDGGMSHSSEVSQSAVVQSVRENEELISSMTLDGHICHFPLWLRTWFS